MKILKPGKVEQRKFVCPRCGCVFVANGRELEYNHKTEEYETICPNLECGAHIESRGEPYEEPTQEDSRLKLIFLIKNFRACNLETADCEADFLIANGVTFREGD